MQKIKEKDVKKKKKPVKDSKKEIKKEVIEEKEIDKNKPKNNNLLTGVISIVALVFVIILCFALTYKNAERINVVDPKLWLAYENSIESIVYNMELITYNEAGSYWAGLKDFDIEDDKYEETLNLFTKDIKECYDEFTLAKEKYKDGNAILKYREVESISVRELEKLREDITESTCYGRFDKYNDMEISDDEDTKIRFMKRIEILQEIYINEMLVKNNPSFDTLLTRKILEASEIDGASAWLRSEYYRLK